MPNSKIENDDKGSAYPKIITTSNCFAADHCLNSSYISSSKCLFPKSIFCFLKKCLFLSINFLLKKIGQLRTSFPAFGNLRGGRIQHDGQCGISGLTASNSSKIRHVYATRASRTMTARLGKLIIYVICNAWWNGLPTSSESLSADITDFSGRVEMTKSSEVVYVFCNSTSICVYLADKNNRKGLALDVT